MASGSLRTTDRQKKSHNGGQSSWLSPFTVRRMQPANHLSSIHIIQMTPAKNQQPAAHTIDEINRLLRSADESHAGDFDVVAWWNANREATK